MINFTIDPEDGDRFEVTADSRDIYTWEKRHKKGKTFQQLMNDLAMVDLYDIAYVAAKRERLVDGTLDQFVKQCVLDFQVDEAPDPTQSAASDEPS